VYWKYATALTLNWMMLAGGPGFAHAQAPVPIPPRVLIALLSGPAIDGITPSGKADFASAQGSTSLAIGAGNINLPDGTMLDIAFDGKFVGQMVVFKGSALQLPFTVPQVHAGEVMTISVGSGGGGVIILGATPTVGDVILSGTFQSP
jgi:hypothetical protein